MNNLNRIIIIKVCNRLVVLCGQTDNGIKISAGSIELLPMSSEQQLVMFVWLSSDSSNTLTILLIWQLINCYHA